MNGFFKFPISEKRMAKVMYAILITKSKIISSHHIGLEKYTRSQNAGHNVSIIVDVDDSKVPLFEELADVKLKTSDEFQGKMVLN